MNLRAVLVLTSLGITISIACCLIAYVTRHQSKLLACEGSQSRIVELLDQLLLASRLNKNANTTVQPLAAVNASTKELAHVPESCEIISELLSLMAFDNVLKTDTYGEYETIREKFNVKHRLLDSLLDQFRQFSNDDDNWRHIRIKWFKLKGILSANLTELGNGFVEIMKRCAQNINALQGLYAVQLYHNLQGNSPTVSPISTIIGMAYNSERSSDPYYSLLFIREAKLDYVSAARSTQALLYQMKIHNHENEFVILHVDYMLNVLIRRNVTQKERSRALPYLSDAKLRSEPLVEGTIQEVTNKTISGIYNKGSMHRALYTHGEIIISKICNFISEDIFYNIIAICHQKLADLGYLDTDIETFTESVRSVYKCIISSKSQKTLPVLALIKLLNESYLVTRQLGPTLSDIEINLHKMLPGVFSNAGKMLQTGEYKSIALLAKWEPDCYRSNLNNFLDEAYTGDHDSMWSVVNFPMCLPEEDKTATFKAMVQHPRYSRSIFILVIKGFVDSSNSTSDVLKITAEKAVGGWVGNLFESYTARDKDYMDEVQLFVMDNRTRPFFDANVIMNQYLDSRARDIANSSGDLFQFLADLNQPSLTVQFLSSLYWRVNETGVELPLTLRIASVLQNITADTEEFHLEQLKVTDDLPSSVLAIVKGKQLNIASFNGGDYFSSDEQPTFMTTSVSVKFENFQSKSSTVTRDACVPSDRLTYALLVRDGCFHRDMSCCMDATTEGCWYLHDKDFRNNVYYVSFSANQHLVAAFNEQKTKCDIMEVTDTIMLDTLWKIEPLP